MALRFPSGLTMCPFLQSPPRSPRGSGVTSPVPEALSLLLPELQPLPGLGVTPALLVSC